MSSAFLHTSVYHWAKSTSILVIWLTCLLLSCAIASQSFCSKIKILSEIHRLTLYGQREKKSRLIPGFQAISRPCGDTAMGDKIKISSVFMNGR